MDTDPETDMDRTLDMAISVFIFINIDSLTDIVPLKKVRTMKTFRFKNNK
jgi:hypothetical protein